MTATSATSPATVVSDSTVGTVSWSSPSNAVSSNDSRATAALNSSTSEYLKATNFSFAVPTNAIINGIKVEVEKSRTAGTGTPGGYYRIDEQELDRLRERMAEAAQARG